jgi:hypothetical protein
LAERAGIPTNADQEAGAAARHRSRGARLSRVAGLVAIMVLGLIAIGLQRALRPKGKALDLYAAFKSESYDATLAQAVIDRANTGTREPLRAAS